MADRYQQMLTFVAVPAGGQATLPHDLNTYGTKRKPDEVAFPPGSAFALVVGTDTTITVQNNGAVAASVTVRVTWDHTILRAYGDARVKQLTPTPFVLGGSADPGTGLFQPTYVDPQTELIRYVDATTGSDSSDGETSATAWLTLRKGMIWQQRMIGVNVNAILQIAGDFTSQTQGKQLDWGVFDLGPFNQKIDFNATGPDQFYSRAPRRVRALPVLVKAITSIAAVADATTGLYTFQVAEVLVPGAHKGQFLIGTGLGQWCCIKDNDASHLTLAVAATNPTTFVSPAIYKTGATINAGDGADPFTYASILTGLCDWQFQFLKFDKGAAQFTGLATYGLKFLSLNMCDLVGVDQNPAMYVIADACYIHDGGFQVAAAPIEYRNCVFENLTPLFHQTGQFTNLLECWWVNSGPFGGGVSQPRTNFACSNTDFGGSSGDGVVCGDALSALSNCKVHDSVGNGVVVKNGAKLNTLNVDGGTNGGYGILRSGQGSECTRDGASAVTGTLGDDGIMLGARRQIATGSVVALVAGGTSTQGPFTRWPNERVFLEYFVTDDVAGAEFGVLDNDATAADRVTGTMKKTGTGVTKFNAVFVNRNGVAARSFDFTVVGEGV